MILISDFDGTLKRQEISTLDIQAIEEFRRQGHIFGIATGRPMNELTEEMSPYNIAVDFIIAANGGIVQDDKVSSHSKIHFETINRLATFLSQFEEVFLILSDGYEYSPPIDLSKNLVTAIGIPNVKETIFNSACIISTKGDIYSRIYDRLLSQNFQELDFFYNNYENGTIDIVQKGVSKSNTIKKVLIDGLHYQKSDIHVIGNSLNDTDMVRDFDGYAVADGDKKLVRLAYEVFPDVAACIDHLLSSE